MGGFFGVVSEGNCSEDVFYGTDYHSHLGTMRGGMVVLDDSKFQRRIHNIVSSSFRTEFESFVPLAKGNTGIGVISDYESQPLIIKSRLGTYSIAHVGKVINLDDLVENLSEVNVHFSEPGPEEKTSVNPTEVIAALINQGKSFVDGIELMQNSVVGSSSIMILTHDGIYLARDKYGRTPLAVARRENDKRGRSDSWAASLETTAFPNRGFGFKMDLGPGEIGLLNEKGYTQLKAPQDKMQICSFLWVYYGYPSSIYQGIATEPMRNRSGRLLAIADKSDGKRLEIDVVAGIPDSGTGHAIGYANESKFSYGRPLVKYTPTWPRSFMPQEQSLRDLVAQMKLIPIEELIRGKRLLFCEDSIVRGTQLRDNIDWLFKDFGALEIHMRPACPPLMYSCDYLNFSRSRSLSDLAAIRAIQIINRQDGKTHDRSVFSDDSSDQHQRMVDEVGRDLGLTSLKYQKINNLVAAIGLPKEKLCTHCWDGSSYCSGCK